MTGPFSGAFGPDYDAVGGALPLFGPGVDLADSGTRPPQEIALEENWHARMRNHPPGLDPATNAIEHADLVATATATSSPVPVEQDGTILGGEKERILAGIWYDDGMPLLGPEDLPINPEDRLHPPLPDSWFDMFTPIGTPEGARPVEGEYW